MISFSRCNEQDKDKGMCYCKKYVDIVYIIYTVCPYIFYYVLSLSLFLVFLIKTIRTLGDWEECGEGRLPLPGRRKEVFLVHAVSQTVGYATDNSSSDLAGSHLTQFGATCITVERGMRRA